MVTPASGSRGRRQSGPRGVPARCSAISPHRAFAQTMSGQGLGREMAPAEQVLATGYPAGLPLPLLLLLLKARGKEQISERRCWAHFSPGQSKGPALLSLLSYFLQGPDRGAERAGLSALGAPPPEGGTWGHLSHPVSPALPNTGWGAAQTVWLNEEKVFPRPSQAGDPSPQGGQEAPLAAPGSGAPSPLGQAQQGTETKGTPQQCPGWGMDATTNLRVWASPQGPGKADQTPFTLPLRQGRKEGGVTGRKEAPEPSQGTPLTPALPRHATPCYTHTHARIPRHCSR